MSENIIDLKNMPLWIGYKNIYDNNENCKILYINPHTGNEINIEDEITDYERSQFGTYEQVINSFENFHIEGACFYSNNDYTVIAITNVHDNKNASFEPLISEIIHSSNSYTEYDPKENKVFILFKYTTNDKINIERKPYNSKSTIIISNDCFTELTFKYYKGEKPIIEADQEHINNIIDTYFHCGLFFRSIGSHYKYDIDNGISLWCVAQKSGLFIPFITQISSKKIFSDNIARPLDEAKEKCIQWRNELAVCSYDITVWSNWDKKLSPPPTIDKYQFRNIFKPSSYHYSNPKE